jgi:cytochrome P450
MTVRDVMLNESIFPDPTSFKPERWIQKEQTFNLDRYYVPFGRGHRMCIGWQ